MIIMIITLTILSFAAALAVLFTPLDDPTIGGACAGYLLGGFAMSVIYELWKLL